MDNSAFKSILAAADHTYVKPTAKPQARGGEEAKKEKRRKKRPREGTHDGSRRNHGEKHEYRDLAAQRRAREANEKKDGDGEAAATAAASADFEQSKHLGGDVEHTHLVKGLDFALLYKIRREAEAERTAADAAAKQQGGAGSSHSSGRGAAKPEGSAFARRILARAMDTHEAALKQQAASGSGGASTAAADQATLREQLRRALLRDGGGSRFAPGRLTFRLNIETDPDAAGYGEDPAAVLRSGAECPGTDVGVLDRLPLELRASLCEVARAAMQGDDALRKLRRRRRRAEREAAEKAAAERPALPPAVVAGARAGAGAGAAEAAAEAGGDDDGDDDIFGDVEDDYAFGATTFAAAAALVPAVAEAASEGTEAVSPPAGLAAASRSSLGELIKQGKLRVHSHAEEEEQEEEEEEGDMIAGYVEEQPGGDDGYGDMGLEGLGGALAADALADTTGDGGGGAGTSADAARAPTKRRYDFATEEEFSKYKLAQESGSSAAFQDGGKKGSGRMSDKELARRKAAAQKRRFEQDLKDIDARLEQRRSGSKPGELPEHPSAKRAKLSGASSSFVH